MFDEILDHVRQSRGRMLDLLARLVNTDTGTVQCKPGLDQMATILAGRLEELDFQVSISEQTVHGNHVVGRKEGSGNSQILLVGHMDTVFGPGTAQDRPFVIRQGKAYGPGVCDMKGGIVCLLFAVEALRNSRPHTFDELGITVLFNSDEEVFSPSSRLIAEKEAKRAQSACVLEPARLGGEYVTSRKGVGQYHLEITGRAAHAGTQPEVGISAVEELAHKIIAAHRITDLAQGTTVNVSPASGGERSNVVAERASADIDVRAWTLQELESAQSALQAIARRSYLSGATSQLTGGVVLPPMERTEAGAKLFELVREAATHVGFEAQETGAGGVSDANHIASYTPTVDGMGPVGSELHSPREFMVVSTLPQRTQALSVFLELWSNCMHELAPLATGL